jgi:hypothetical protein
MLNAFSFAQGTLDRYNQSPPRNTPMPIKRREQKVAPKIQTRAHGYRMQAGRTYHIFVILFGFEYPFCCEENNIPTINGLFQRKKIGEGIVTIAIVEKNATIVAKIGPMRIAATTNVTTDENQTNANASRHRHRRAKPYRR